MAAISWKSNWPILDGYIYENNNFMLVYPKEKLFLELFFTDL